MPDLRDELKRSVKHVEKGSAASFKTLGGILSGPEALIAIGTYCRTFPRTKDFVGI